MIFCGDIFAVYAEIHFVEIDARNSITYLKFVIFFWNLPAKRMSTVKHLCMMSYGVDFY